MCLTNQSSKKNYAVYGEYTDLQTCFSEKYIWHSSLVFLRTHFPKFQGNRSGFKNVIGCG